MKLTAELVPKTAWNKSLAKLLPRVIWKSTRANFIRENGRKCQICGETEETINLHEIWNYDDANHVQKLDGFILLCSMCHQVKHIGLAGILSQEGKLNYSSVVRHFCEVNDCSVTEFERHVKDTFVVWRERSKYQWKQDFGDYAKFIQK